MASHQVYPTIPWDWSLTTGSGVGARVDRQLQLQSLLKEWGLKYVNITAIGTKAHHKSPL